MDAGVRGLVLGAAATVTVLAAYTMGAAGVDTVGPAAGTPAGTTALAGSGSPAPGDVEAGGADTITVRGTGQVTGVPDQLSFRLRVTRTADDVTTALDDASASMRRTLRALEREGVPRKDVQTTDLDIRASYDYSSSGPPVLTGYVASQTVSVLVAELHRAGATLGAAVEAGGNAVRVSGVRLRIGDRDELLALAREAAVAEARTKVDEYAAASGRTLDGLVSLREVRSAGGAPVELDYRSARDAVAAVPIRAGSKEIAVTVSTVWQIA